MTKFNNKSENETLVIARFEECHGLTAAGTWTSSKVDRSDCVARFAVGEKFTRRVDAPGCGRVTYIISRVDEEGAWGVLVGSAVVDAHVSR